MLRFYVAGAAFSHLGARCWRLFEVQDIKFLEGEMFALQKSSSVDFVIFWVGCAWLRCNVSRWPTNFDFFKGNLKELTQAIPVLDKCNFNSPRTRSDKWLESLMLLPFFTPYPLLENHLPSSIQMKSHQGVARKLAIKISQDVLDWKWHVCEPANIPKLEAWDAMHLRISFSPTSAMRSSFDSRVCSSSGGNTMATCPPHRKPCD